MVYGCQIKKEFYFCPDYLKILEFHCFIFNYLFLCSDYLKIFEFCCFIFDYVDSDPNLKKKGWILKTEWTCFILSRFLGWGIGDVQIGG